MNTDKNRIKELEEVCCERQREIEKLKAKEDYICEKFRGEIMELRAENAHLKDKISRIERPLKEPMFSENIPDYEKLCKELQAQHQSDCITINQLNVALDIMCEKYSRLREIHGL